jgi:transcriptional regulator with XRE-family HTH domain
MVIKGRRTHMFENKISYWMEKRGLKNKYIAKLCGVSETTFSKWRQNKTQPDIEVAAIIAEALSITVDQLIYGEDENDGKERRGKI